MLGLLVVLLLGACSPAAFAVNGELELRVVDEASGELIPVRVHLKNSKGKSVHPLGSVFWHDHFIVPGKLVLDLPPGRYQFEIERGPEYKIRSGYFDLKSGDLDNKEVTLPRFVDMAAAGWWSGDLHIHRPPADIELLMAAEDLHIAPVITWWNDRNPWAEQAPPVPSVTRGEGNRFYDVMAGEDEREGGALLYFGLQRPLPLMGAAREHPSPVQFLKQARAEGVLHVDVEKPFWWDMPVWVASGLVDSIGVANNHQQRGGMLDNEAWGRPRDKLRYPSPDGNGVWSTDIYYKLLNCGLRIPPSAGSASGVLPNPVGYNRVYVHVEGELTWENWWEGLKAGRVVVTNGPLLEPRVNGELPGHVFTAGAGETVTLNAELNLALRDKVDYLEVVQDGRVVHQVRLDKYAESGGRLPEVEFHRSGWMLIRAVTATPGTYRCGTTGPYYVEIGGRPAIHRDDAQFFLDWVRERAARIKLEPPQREEVIQYHRAARDFWQRRVDEATVSGNGAEPPPARSDGKSR